MQKKGEGVECARNTKGGRSVLAKKQLNSMLKSSRARESRLISHPRFLKLNQQLVIRVEGGCVAGLAVPVSRRKK